MKTSTTKTVLGAGVEVTILSEWDEGRRWDTTIKIQDQTLCVISGDDYEEFMQKFQYLINRYSI